MFQLGMEIYTVGGRCRACEGSMDVWGDHAVQCATGPTSGYKWRHEELQRELVRLCGMMDLTTRTNVVAGTDEHERLEPGDVVIPGWGNEAWGDLYLDIFIVAPWSAAATDFSAFDEVRAATAYAERKKVKYAVVFPRGGAHAFRPLGFDVFSGILTSSLPFLRRLHSRCSEACSEAVVEPRVFPRLSLSIACSVGHQLESRLPLGRFLDLPDADYRPGSGMIER
jgi:hypothetical protein